ncbi:hypothetical protein IC617_09860 [Neiella sp. HB171785]|uniref:Uncharacterized protein n=1 Tax=Neiella litorisoli TaxID=2771431 RepID=A0A8J6QHH2_9GAMM|nr:hypothetical protein [Neiella litorisoli]MBD1389735.1 hypothetical protein [Neiella litorisoli]
MSEQRAGSQQHPSVTLKSIHGTLYTRHPCRLKHLSALLAAALGFDGCGQRTLGLGVAWELDSRASAAGKRQ